MPKNPLEYTEPQARDARRLAKSPDYQTEEGEPDRNLIASATGLHRDAVRYVLDGTLPDGKRPENKPAPSTVAEEKRLAKEAKDSGPLS